MLGDNPEKSKNPLKKAMRRRNAKTVTFTAPTFIEASEMEFSSGDEMDGADYFNSDDDEASSAANESDAQDNENKGIVVEPLKPKHNEPEEPEKAQPTQEPERVDTEEGRPSEESIQQDGKDPCLPCIMAVSDTDFLTFRGAAEPTVSRSRNGTVRNTDSFFKDDSIETKKISLTPNLLRDEHSTIAPSSEGKEVRGIPTSDRLLHDR